MRHVLSASCSCLFKSCMLIPCYAVGCLCETIKLWSLMNRSRVSKWSERILEQSSALWCSSRELFETRNTRPARDVPLFMSQSGTVLRRVTEKVTPSVPSTVGHVICSINCRSRHLCYQLTPLACASHFPLSDLHALRNYSPSICGYS